MMFSTGIPTTSTAIKVLIIEDSLGYARLIYELLKMDDPYGFEIFHNVKLESGLDRLSRTNIDIILLDLGLPDSIGLDTLVKVLKYINNQVPVVIFSNRNDEDFIQEAIKLGAQDYLIKGEFDSRLLRHTLKSAIERKRLITQLELQAEEIKKKNTRYELSEKRLHYTINNLPGVFMIYDSNRNIKLMNNTAAEIWNKYLKGKSSWNSRLNASYLQNIENCFKKNQIIISEHSIKLNGKEISGRFNFLPVSDSEDRVCEVIVSSYNLVAKNE